MIAFLFQLSAHADVTTEARELFVNYLDSIYKKEYSKLISLMDENFLKKTGGKEHWKDVLKGPQKKEVVDKVEVKKINNYYFARFSLKSATGKEQELTDNWFVLIKKDEKLLLYDFASDFDPEEK